MEQYNIFDFDGTIADSLGVWEHSADRLLAHWGKTARSDLTQRLAHLNMPDSARLIREEYNLKVSVETLVKQATEDVEQAYLFRIQPRQGVERVLKTLRDRNARMAVATSTDNRLVQAALDRMGLAKYFDFVLTARPGLSKDKPDIYREALTRLGGTDPAKAAVFEDNPICAATAAGAGFRVYVLREKSNIDQEKELRRVCRAYLNDWQEWEENL